MPQDDIDEFLSRYKGGSEIDKLYAEYAGQQQPASTCAGRSAARA